MVPFRFSTRRLIFSAAEALVLAVAPAAGALAGPATYFAPRIVADPAHCTTDQSKSAVSIACVPDVAPGTGGAPGEQTVTDSNPGTASPTRLGLFGIHGGLRL